jgi:hypothetical protein
MKNAILALLFVASSAIADPVLIATGKTEGASLFLYNNVDKCYTGIGVIASVPGMNIPGCVTENSNFTNTHVVYIDESGADYPSSIWHFLDEGDL